MSADPNSLQAPPLGTTLDGAYLLERFLGAGGMGAVYEAVTNTGERVAVKVLLGAAGRQEGAFLERFEREANITSSLSSPNIVATIDTGVDEKTGLSFMVMPLMIGLDLEDFTIHHGPLQPTVAVRVARHACAALAVAHDHGIVHRDMKPANVFLDYGPAEQVTVRVLDFGIAKWADDDKALTQTGSLLGTPLFMSPEQLLDTKGVTAQCDIWGLGATLYHALAGTPPFDEEKTLGQLYVAISAGDVPHLQDVAPWIDPGLAAVVHGTLLRERTERCPDIEALARALEVFNDGSDEILVSMLEPLPVEQLAKVAPRLEQLPTSWHPAEPTAPSPSLTLADADPLLGTTLGDQYTLLRRLGVGGMGAVYEAQGPDGQRYALKVMAAAQSRKESQRRRFVREARAVTSIDSDHVVRVLQADTDDAQERPFIVMDLLQGVDLAVLIERQGPLHPTTVARLFAQACQGLMAAHDQGIVHRDIKPANLFLHQLPSGEITLRICDFGIAKQINVDGHDKTTVNLTRTGGVVGSPMFMSPEQSKSARDVDARTDIWSIGVSIYQALSGVTPWEGKETVGEIIVAICTEQVPHLQDRAPWVPPGLAEVVHATLRRNRDDRFQTAHELGEALMPFTNKSLTLSSEQLSGVSAPTREAVAKRGTGPETFSPAVPSGATQPLGGLPKSRAPLIAAGAAALAIGGGSLLYLGGSTPETTAPIVAPPSAASVNPNRFDIQVEIIPAEAQVLVDGKPRQLANGKLDLSGEPGDTFVVVVTRGQQKRQQEVTILRGGRVKPAEIALAGSSNTRDPPPRTTATPGLPPKPAAPSKGKLPPRF